MCLICTSAINTCWYREIRVRFCRRSTTSPICLFLVGKISHNSRSCGHATLTSTFTLFLQPSKYVPFGHDVSFSSSPPPSLSPTLSKSLSNCAVLGMIVEGHCWVHADRSRCMRMLLARIAGLMWWLRSRIEVHPSDFALFPSFAAESTNRRSENSGTYGGRLGGEIQINGDSSSD